MKRLLLLGSLIFAISGCCSMDGMKAAAKPAASPAQTPAAEGVMATCPIACTSMNCPPPGGAYKLCCPVAPYNQTCP